MLLVARFTAPLLGLVSAPGAWATPTASAALLRLRRALRLRGAAGQGEIAVEHVVERRPIGVILHQRRRERLAQHRALDPDACHRRGGIEAFAQAWPQAGLAKGVEEAEELVAHLPGRRGRQRQQRAIDHLVAEASRGMTLASALRMSSSCLSTRLRVWRTTAELSSRICSARRARAQSSVSAMLGALCRSNLRSPATKRATWSCSFGSSSGTLRAMISRSFSTPGKSSHK